MFPMGEWLKTKTPDSNLGHLERELMEHVWTLQEASVSAVHEELGGRLAYTTIMTTLDRLFKKGILERRKVGRAFLYSPRLSQAEFKQSMVKKALSFLIEEHKKETVPLMAYL